MAHFYYRYEVYIKDNVEYTLLKWLEDGDVTDTRKIDKPTSELTPEDLAILDEFLLDGSIIKPKYEADAPDEGTALQNIPSI